MLKNNTFVNNKIVRVFLIPLFLLIFWFFASIFTDPYASITTLEYPHSISILEKTPAKYLLKGDKVTGFFVGSRDNLGIVSMRVDGGRSDIPGGEDVLNFRIKEKKSSTWYYENQYRVGSIKEDEFIVFGFPKISNSYFKTYQFEISSLKGTSENAISINHEYPTFYTKYVYSFKHVLNEKKIVNLFIDKFYSMMIDSRSFFYSLLFLLPFIFYISLTILRKVLNSYLESIVILLTFLDILQTRYEIYAFTLCILWFWILAVRRNKINYSYHILLAVIYFVLAIIVQFWELSETATKSSMWGYYFLTIACIQMIYEFIKKERKDNKTK